MTDIGFPLPEGLDLFARSLVAGATIPGQFKKKKKKELPSIPDKSIVAIAFSMERPGYSSRITIDERSWLVHLTQHELRVWVDADWNREKPTFQGEVVLSSLRRAVEEIQIRQFLAPEQIHWLMTANPATGELVAESVEWIDDLYRNHGVVVAGVQPNDWKLTDFGRHIVSALAKVPVGEPAPLA